MRDKHTHSLMSLWRELADESASWCGTSTTLDFKKVERRVNKEGESFLTITLPKFCKDFQQSLELGSIDPGHFVGFKRRGGFPLFLGGFLGQIFDSSGTLLDSPSIDCIRAVRELTLVFSKIERQCSNARIARAMQGYVELEAELEAMDTSSFEEFLPLFQKASTLLWGDVFANVENKLLGVTHLKESWDDSHEESHYSWTRLPDPMDSLIGLPGSPIPPVKAEVDFQHSSFVGRTVFRKACQESLVPSHGPGATADGLRGNAKFEVDSWPARIESVFPYGDYALASWRNNDQLARVQFLEPGAEVPVKVTPVPKTDRTPRIIAEEPTAVQYCQQAIAHELVNELEHAGKLHPHIAGKRCDLGGYFVGFRDQEPNRFLAKEGSRNGFLATLDLSEASDRVLNEHVKLLFARFPHLDEAVQATRSLKARVPGHGVISLTKFSSMGSALCFPVEAMVFTTIVFAAIAYERRVPLDRGLIMSMRGIVRVYGDDIIVPVEYVQRVIQFLEVFGLKVNKDKSFWNGKFRESCGGDFYEGEWVTPVRLKHELPRSLADVSGVVGLVSFRNLLYWNGYWKTADTLDKQLRVLLKGHWSIAESTAAGLHRDSVHSYKSERHHGELHTPLIKGAVVQQKFPKSPLQGDGALLKYFLQAGLIPHTAKDHLERSGRPVAARIKLRGIRPY